MKRGIRERSAAAQRPPQSSLRDILYVLDYIGLYLNTKLRVANDGASTEVLRTAQQTAGKLTVAFRQGFAIEWPWR